jgi:hypothetical protein
VSGGGASSWFEAKEAIIDEQLGTLRQAVVVWGQDMQLPMLTKVRLNRQALCSRAMFGPADALRRRLGNFGLAVRDTNGCSSGDYGVHAKRRIDARAVGRGRNPSFIVAKVNAQAV